MQAVIFDLDDTLIVDEAVSKEALQEAAQTAAAHGAEPVKFARDAAAHAKRLWAAGPCHDYCKSIGISAFECLWGKFLGDSEELTKLREWATEFRVQAFDAALREQMLDLPNGAEEIAAKFENTRRSRQRLMPNALEMLARLKGVKLGLLTNGAPDLQREKLAASGLAPSFDAIVVSGEHGIGKPKPEIFHRLLSELGVSASEAVMVGNSLERDIAGARNAGLASVWIKVSGSEEHAPVQPTATIENLGELPAVLEKLSQVEAA